MRGKGGITSGVAFCRFNPGSSGGDDGNGGSSPTTSSYTLGMGLSMVSEFVEDQVREDNFTDLDLICGDGYVPVHRCLLMAASPFVRELLIDKHIAETTAISLPDVRVQHMKIVLSLLYSGRALVGQQDQAPVYDVLMMLQLLDMVKVFYRQAKETDADSIVELKHRDFIFQYQYQNMDGDGDGEQEQEEDEQDEEKEEDEIEIIYEEPPNSPIDLVEEDSDNGGGEEELPLQNEDNNDENEDPVVPVPKVTSKSGAKKKRASKGRKTRKTSVGSSSAKDDTNDKVEFVAIKEEVEDVEPGDEQEEKYSPKEYIRRRLRKRPDGRKTPPPLPKKKKKKVAVVEKPAENKENKSSKISEKESNHDESSKEDDDDDEDGGGRNSCASPLPPVLVPEFPIQSQARRFPSLASIASSTSSSGATRPGKVTRVFIETKEFGGVQYNFYGYWDPILQGVQPGKTIAIDVKDDRWDESKWKD